MYFITKPGWFVIPLPANTELLSTFLPGAKRQGFRDIMMTAAWQTGFQ